MTAAFKRLSLAGKLMAAGGAALGGLLLAASLLISVSSGQAVRGLAPISPANAGAQIEPTRGCLDSAKPRRVSPKRLG